MAVQATAAAHITYDFVAVATQEHHDHDHPEISFKGRPKQQTRTAIMNKHTEASFELLVNVVT